MVNLNSLILPEYQKVIKNLQAKLAKKGNTIEITQSLIELWKFIFNKHPEVIEVNIPDYPDYVRAWVVPISRIDPDINWMYVERADFEYFRVVEFFSKKSDTGRQIKINLHQYDVNNGVHWMDLNPANVIEFQ